MQQIGVCPVDWAFAQKGYEVRPARAVACSCKNRVILTEAFLFLPPYLSLAMPVSFHLPSSHFSRPPGYEQQQQ